MDPQINDKAEEPRTKADNNAIVIKSLVGLAALCCVMSTGVLFLGKDIKELLPITFGPIMIIIPGLLGFLKS